MRDEDCEPTGSGSGEGITKRVGTADRDEAIVRLGEHWRAGWLDPAEHELRVTRAKVEVTQADLDALFVDLPQPGPARGSTGAVAPARGRGSLANLRETIMALMEERRRVVVGTGAGTEVVSRVDEAVSFRRATSVR